MSNQSAAIKVLLVEDNPGDVRLIRGMLAEARDVRFDLECADRLSTGLARLATENVDVLLLDLGLPDSVGFETFAKAYAQAPHVPIIVLSSLQDETVALRAVREGAQDYLGKGETDRRLLARAIRYAIERKREVQQLRLQAAALAAAANGIVITDNDGRIVWVNPAFIRLSGYTLDEVRGQNPRFLKSGRQDRTFYEQLWTTITSGQVWHGELINRRKDGTLFTEEMTITPVHDEQGKTTHYVAIKQDITERQRNRELEEQYRQVQEANRLKSEFLANMSHELRTPLNGIIGFAELMHDGKVGPVSPDHREYLGDILTSARHLLQLINDVLDLAKVESGKMEFRPEPLDLSKVAGEVRDILRTLAAKKRIRLETEIDPRLTGIVADSAKLKQVLYNYLSNALKFTPDEGHVTVRFSSEGQDAFRLEVADTGIGIRPEDLSRLFVEFQQLDAGAAKKYPGTGLGLALTRRLVEAQGGTVGVHSTPGQGSVFFAVLPRVSRIQDTPAAAPQGAPLASAQPGALSVLVIEDDAKDRAWLRRTLGGAGYDVHLAATGAEALQQCRERAFDAITLDLLLPDMNGWDVLRAIRDLDPHKHTPAIVVSVVADKDAALGFTIQDFLVKPVKADDLVAAIRQAASPGMEGSPLLVVDDDPTALKLAAQALTAAGYRPLTERHAEMGLRMAARERPALVILDLLMPGMDGFEFLRRFRRTKGGRHTPVIIWTVKDLTTEERARLRASAQAVVLKGEGSSAELHAEIRMHLPPRRVECPANRS